VRRSSGVLPLEKLPPALNLMSLMVVPLVHSTLNVADAGALAGEVGSTLPKNPPALHSLNSWIFALNLACSLFQPP